MGSGIGKIDLEGAPTALSDELGNATTSPGPGSNPETRPDSPYALARAREAVFARGSAAATTRFEQLRLLGKGGMGEVVLARDNDIGRMVAIKHLLAPKQLDRFAEEVRTVGQLEHPNIPPVHDVGIDGRGHFFVMKYIDGETLASIIHKLAAGDPEYRRRYSFERRTDIFIGVLRALEFAHSRGILHRDLKPSNVMVGRHGEVMLMDWGIARPTRAPEPDAAPHQPSPSPSTGQSPPRSESTFDGELVGTPPYMSPEQARGDNAAVDERSDVYAASVLFHELLCLKHYLADLCPPNKLPALVSWLTSDEEPGWLSLMMTRRAEGAPLIPSELLHVLTKGLRKNPSDRYQSVTEMIEALQRIREGRFRVQCVGTLSKRVSREFGRVVDWNPLVGLAMLLLVAGLAGYGLVRVILAFAGGHG